MAADRRFSAFPAAPLGGGAGVVGRGPARSPRGPELLQAPPGSSRTRRGPAAASPRPHPAAAYLSLAARAPGRGDIRARPAAPTSGRVAAAPPPVAGEAPGPAEGRDGAARSRRPFRVCPRRRAQASGRRPAGRRTRAPRSPPAPNRPPFLSGRARGLARVRPGGRFEDASPLADAPFRTPFPELFRLPDSRPGLWPPVLVPAPSSQPAWPAAGGRRAGTRARSVARGGLLQSSGAKHRHTR